MSAAITFTSETPPPFPMHRFTVAEYRQLGELGVLAPEDRVELLEGWIVEKMNHRPAHGYAVRYLNNWLVRVLPVGWLAQCQLPIATDTSEPEPDLAVVHGKDADFSMRHPYANECRLLIEVADTSLAKDRAKAAIYAAAGVSEYWIVNLIDRRLERFQQSDGNTYREQSFVTIDNTIELDLDDMRYPLELAALFPADS
ncbi:MAG: Uma2 family endonuclease [Pirellulaceae bacterium]|jgi:Uma2 family endonuclease|nr:Uma2 family endonuclease [Pirellulaceae bacterium]